MTSIIIPATERNVLLAVKPSVKIVIAPATPHTPALVVIAPSSENNAWPIITLTPRRMAPKPTPPKKIKNVCSSLRKCPRCNRLLRPREIETRHVCGTAECPSCMEYHNLY